MHTPAGDEWRGLAGRLVEVLARTLPRLLGESGSGAAAASFPDGEAWEAAKEIWDQLQPMLEAKIAATEAVQDLAEGPEDPDRQAALRNQLRKILSSDQALAEQLAGILQSHAPSVAYSATSQAGGIAQGERPVAAGAGGIAVGGNAGNVAQVDESLRAGGIW